MQSIRRSAFRAIISPSSSFLSTSRSISTSSPFVLRASKTASVSPIFRRFQHDDSENKPVENSENQQSTYEAVTETVTENATAAKDTVVDAAESVAAATGFGGWESRENRVNTDRPRRDGDKRRDFEDRAALEPNPTIYVGNLLFEVAPADLEELFSEFGTVKSVMIAQDDRGFSKGFGRVEFETVDQATAAIEAKHQTIFEGRKLIVNYQAQTRNVSRELKEPSKTVFIGNLAFEMSDQDLNNLFRDVRNVLDVRVAIDRRTGQPRGFAHADFVDVESAVKGLEFLQNKEVYGRRLRCDYSGPARTSEGGERRGGRGFDRGGDRRERRGGDRNDRSSF